MNILIGDINVNYFTLGEASSDEAVVMLHGWGSNITLFENAARLVSERYYEEMMGEEADLCAGLR